MFFSIQIIKCSNYITPENFLQNPTDSSNVIIAYLCKIVKIAHKKQPSIHKITKMEFFKSQSIKKIEKLLDCHNQKFNFFLKFLEKENKNINLLSLFLKLMQDDQDIDLYNKRCKKKDKIIKFGINTTICLTFFYICYFFLLPKNYAITYYIENTWFYLMFFTLVFFLVNPVVNFIASLVIPDGIKTKWGDYARQKIHKHSKRANILLSVICTSIGFANDFANKARKKMFTTSEVENISYKIISNPVYVFSFDCLSTWVALFSFWMLISLVVVQGFRSFLTRDKYQYSSLDNLLDFVSCPILIPELLNNLLLKKDQNFENQFLQQLKLTDMINNQQNQQKMLLYDFQQIYEIENKNDSYMQIIKEIILELQDKRYRQDDIFEQRHPIEIWQDNLLLTQKAQMFLNTYSQDK